MIRELSWDIQSTILGEKKKEKLEALFGNTMLNQVPKKYKKKRNQHCSICNIFDGNEMYRIEKDHQRNISQ